MKKRLKETKDKKMFRNWPKKRGQWSNEALRLSINAFDSGYKMKDVCKRFGIPRSTLREQYLGKNFFFKKGQNVSSP